MTVRCVLASDNSLPYKCNFLQFVFIESTVVLQSPFPPPLLCSGEPGNTHQIRHWFVFRKAASAKTLMMAGCGAFYVGSRGGE